MASWFSKKQILFFHFDPWNLLPKPQSFWIFVQKITQLSFEVFFWHKSNILRWADAFCWKLPSCQKHSLPSRKTFMPENVPPALLASPIPSQGERHSDCFLTRWAFQEQLHWGIRNFWSYQSLVHRITQEPVSYSKPWHPPLIWLALNKAIPHSNAVPLLYKYIFPCGTLWLL